MFFQVLFEDLSVVWALKGYESGQLVHSVGPAL